MLSLSQQGTLTLDLIMHLIRYVVVPLMIDLHPECGATEE
jgi:hypothetical protein